MLRYMHTSDGSATRRGSAAVHRHFAAVHTERRLAGVQWHPEWRVTENELSLAMFKAFGAACRNYAAQRQV